MHHIHQHRRGHNSVFFFSLCIRAYLAEVRRKKISLKVVVDGEPPPTHTHCELEVDRSLDAVLCGHMEMKECCYFSGALWQKNIETTKNDKSTMGAQMWACSIVVIWGLYERLIWRKMNHNTVKSSCVYSDPGLWGSFGFQLVVFQIKLSSKLGWVTY